jgi:hypothetical protein
VQEERVKAAGQRQRVERRPDDWRQAPKGRKRPSGMDFGGFTMAEMYAKADRAAASRRRRKSIHTLKDLLAFMKEDETVEMQQRRQIAWQSIQSVRGTLQRELGLEDVLFSCGWSTLHLNTTAMILLQTLRKYTRANTPGIFTPNDFLRGATIDISANPSGIDFSNEYRIGLNPADVPVQWVQVLETLDADMVVFMKAAREGLAALQVEATTALEGAYISRGFTCSALGYRTFLQHMRQRDAALENGEPGLLAKVALVVEDDSYGWRVLDTGQVRAPFTSSHREAVAFLTENRSQIRRQQDAHNAKLEAFAYISSRCVDAMQLKSITRDEGVPVGEAVAACEALLKAVVGMTPQSARGSIPLDMVRFLDTYTQGRSLRIGRSFGLGQDGVFTLPVDWFKW